MDENPFFNNEFPNLKVFRLSGNNFNGMIDSYLMLTKVI